MSDLEKCFIKPSCQSVTHYATSQACILSRKESGISIQN
ncbi:MAG: PAN domain-containing protein [Isosphaeraceae bacterium]